MKRMAHFQQTLASQMSFEKHGRKSKRELFLDQMNQVVPCSELLSLVEPFYSKAGNGPVALLAPSTKPHAEQQITSIQVGPDQTIERGQIKLTKPLKSLSRAVRLQVDPESDRRRI